MRLPPGTISVSFLDMLSGALAGVIILFIIVPKGTSFAPPELQEQRVAIDSLFVVIDSLYLGKDTLTRVDLERLRENMLSLRTRVDSIQRTAMAYRREVVRRKTRQVILEDSIRLLRQRTAADPEARRPVAASLPKPKPAPRSLPTRRPAPVAAAPTPNAGAGGQAVALPTRSVDSPTAPTPLAQNPAAPPAQPTTQAARATPGDPMPDMLDPFMVDVRWSGTEDVDLLLLNRAGVVVCNDSRCNKKYAGMERSGKRDTAQYERLRVTSRQAEEYEVRLAIHTRFGGKRGTDPVSVSGTYYTKPDPAGPATKRAFTREVAPKQRGDNGAPGVKVGTLTITDDGDVVFNVES